MHMRGEPRTMQKQPFARDVVRDVAAGLRRAVALARRAGVAKSQIVLDPGIGFGKSWRAEFRTARAPSPNSRGSAFRCWWAPRAKSSSASVLGGAARDDRAWGTAATVAASILGGAHIVRVHDVAEMAQVARVADAVINPSVAAAQVLPSK